MIDTGKHGFFYNLPFEEYQRLPGLNQSKLRKFFSSPSNQKLGYQVQQAMSFGSAGHCLLLEPEKFDKLYLCAPIGLRRRGKNGKKNWQEFSKLHAGKNVLSTDDFER